MFRSTSDARPVLRAFVVTGEQCILAIENHRADAVLDDVGIKLDAAVIGKGEPVPVVRRFDFFRHAGELLLESRVQHQHERLAALLSHMRRSSGLRPRIVFSIA